MFLIINYDYHMKKKLVSVVGSILTITTLQAQNPIEKQMQDTSWYLQEQLDQKPIYHEAADSTLWYLSKEVVEYCDGSTQEFKLLDCPELEELERYFNETITAKDSLPYELIVPGIWLLDKVEDGEKKYENWSNEKWILVIKKAAWGVESIFDNERTYSFYNGDHYFGTIDFGEKIIKMKTKSHWWYVHMNEFLWNVLGLCLSENKAEFIKIQCKTESVGTDLLLDFNIPFPSSSTRMLKNEGLIRQPSRFEIFWDDWSQKTYKLQPKKPKTKSLEIRKSNPNLM